MKKCIANLLIFGMVFLGLSSTTNAQIKLGGGLAFGSQDNIGIGIDVKAVFGITETITVSPSYNLFFPGEGADFWTINGDVRYNLVNDESLLVYPLAGLNISRVGFSGFGISGGTSEIGLNLGGGAEFGFSEKLSAFGEIKYIISDFDQLVIAAGILFTL